MKINELEAKLNQSTQQIECMTTDPEVFWYNILNYKTCTMSLPGYLITSVTVKVTEYPKSFDIFFYG